MYSETYPSYYAGANRNAGAPWAGSLVGAANKRVEGSENKTKLVETVKPNLCSEITLSAIFNVNIYILLGVN